MTMLDLDDLRSRINPQYATTPGTESYERRLCVEEIEALRARVAELEKDAARYRWIRNKDNALAAYYVHHYTDPSELDAMIDAARGE